MDKRVEIHGTSRADMNGKCGVATDFHWYEDESKWRYTVQLDSGEAFKLKPANLHYATLRFAVGDRVECHYDSRWLAGEVVALWWRHDSWGADQMDAPYQVRLTGGPLTGELIFSPCDDDQCVRARGREGAREDGTPPPVGKRKGKAKGKVQ